MGDLLIASPLFYAKIKNMNLVVELLFWGAFFTFFVTSISTKGFGGIYAYLTERKPFLFALIIWMLGWAPWDMVLPEAILGILALIELSALFVVSGYLLVYMAKMRYWR